MNPVLSPQRIGRITGSRAPMILGLSPYGDRESVMREMVRQFWGRPSEFNGNIATDWGHEHEPDAIADYERYKGVMVHGGQEFVVHPELDFLGVTPDGLVGETGIVEAKCPYRAGYTSISERPDYYVQTQLQLACTGREWCDFVIWRPDGAAFSHVDYEPAWLDVALPDFYSFMDEYQTYTSSKDRAALFLEDPVDPSRDDMEWQLAALTYLEAHAAAERTDRALKEARQDLIDLSNDEPARGAGVQVLHVNRKGTVDYTAAVKELLPAADLEPWRRSPTVVTQVRRSVA